VGAKSSTIVAGGVLPVTETGGGGMVRPGSGSLAKALQAKDDRISMEMANQKIRWRDILPSWGDNWVQGRTGKKKMNLPCLQMIFDHKIE
jgi:hypothetical protein